MRGVIPDRARAAICGPAVLSRATRSGAGASAVRRTDCRPTTRRQFSRRRTNRIRWQCRDGLVGYLMRVATRNLTFFYSRLYMSLLPFEIAGINISQEPSGTEREVAERILRQILRLRTRMARNNNGTPRLRLKRHGIGRANPVLSER